MKKVMTSITHPIRVDFIDPEHIGLPGKLGLTFAPGKKQPSGQTGHWDRDLDMDLERLREFYETDLLVSLIEEHEFERLMIKDLRERVKRFGIRSIWFPIRDQSIPQSADEFARMVENIIEGLRSGQNVVIHCMGGLGRTGLVAAACLIAAAGLQPEDAVRAVRRVRHGAVETFEQEQFLAAFASTQKQNPYSANHRSASSREGEITSGQIDQLLEFLPVFEGTGREFAVWRGGETNEDGIMTMPHLEYLPEVYSFFELAAQKHWVDYDYGAKSPQEILGSPGRLADATLDEIKTVLTYCVRGERFGDGHWAHLLREGKIRDVLTRLKKIRMNMGG